MADAGGYITRPRRMATLVIARRLRRFCSGWLYDPGTLVNTRCPSRIEPGIWGSGQRTGKKGPDRRWAVRSIRKNSVLPGSDPTDLHDGKNGYDMLGAKHCLLDHQCISDEASVTLLCSPITSNKVGSKPALPGISWNKAQIIHGISQKGDEPQ